MHQPSAQALARAGGSRDARCTTIARASTRAFSAPPARSTPIRGSYVEPAHPVQREVKAALESLTGMVISDDACAIDGCSVPTWAMPLDGAGARASRASAPGQGLAPARAKAAARLRAACAETPWHVAGTGRFCTEVMQTFGARVFVKTGAEGVFCAALPEQGLGIAVKCDDGAGRAAEVVMAATIARYLPSDADRAAMARFVRPMLRNWNGTMVGAIRPTGVVAGPA